MFEKEAEEIANEKLCATTMCYNHIYRSMDEENKREFLEEAKRSKRK